MVQTTLTPEEEWELDGPKCTRCHTFFSLLHRRHHCRYCGRVVCRDCSTPYGLNIGNTCVRVCSDCVDGRPSVLNPRNLKPLEADDIWERPQSARTYNKNNEGTSETNVEDPHIPGQWTHMDIGWQTNPCTQFALKHVFPHEATSVWFEGFGKVEVRVLEALGLRSSDVGQFLGQTSDPYVMLEFDGQSQRTSTVMRSLNPRWNDTVCFRMRCAWAPMRLWIYDWDRGKKDDFLGMCYIPGEAISGLEPRKRVRGWLRARALGDDTQHGTEPRGALLVELSLWPLGDDTSLTAEPSSRKLNSFSNRRYWSFVTQAGWDGALLEEREEFDPEVIFTCVCRIFKVMWERLLYPFLSGVYGILDWTNPGVSAVYFVVLLTLIWFPDWAVITFTLWLASMLHRRLKMRRDHHPLRYMRKISGACTSGLKLEEAARRENSVDLAIAEFAHSPWELPSLHSWVVTGLRTFVSSQHQSTMAAMQPRLRSWAVQLENLDDLIKGRHHDSPKVLKALLVSAGLQLWPCGPQSWQTILLVFIFTYFSPLFAMLSGFLSWHNNGTYVVAEDLFDHVGDRPPHSWGSPEALRHAATTGAFDLE